VRNVLGRGTREKSERERAENGKRQITANLEVSTGQRKKGAIPYRSVGPAKGQEK